MKSDQEEVVENRESGNNGRGEREGRKMRTHGAMWKFKGDKKKVWRRVVWREGTW